MPKTQRQQLIATRAKLNSTATAQAAVDVLAQLQQLPQYQNAQHIACYLSINNEIDTQAIINDIWQQGKSCYLPVCGVGQQMRFARYTAETELETAEHHLQQPCASTAEFIATEALDLVLTPLVGFDLQGNRLGWGQGYYDRCFEFLLQQLRPSTPYLLGLAYECQRIDALNPQAWDVPLDGLLSEQRAYTFH